jgi:hypothetical protein
MVAAASLRRLLKYWSGSRVEAEGRVARSECGASLQRAGTSERRRQPFFCFAPQGLRRFCPRKHSGLLAWPRSLRISALRSRLGQRQNRQQRGPLQYFNSLLARRRFATGEEAMPEPADGAFLLIAPGEVAVLAVKFFRDNFDRTQHGDQRWGEKFSRHLRILDA